MRYENKAEIKAMLLEIFAECDPTFSDVLINRVYPIVKQLVHNEFAKQRNELMLEIAVKLGQIMQGNPKPLWSSSLEELGLDEEDLKQEFGRKR